MRGRVIPFRGKRALFFFPWRQKVRIASSLPLATERTHTSNRFKLLCPLFILRPKGSRGKPFLFQMLSAVSLGGLPLIRIKGGCLTGVLVYLELMGSVRKEKKFLSRVSFRLLFSRKRLVNVGEKGYCSSTDHRQHLRNSLCT